MNTCDASRRTARSRGMSRGRSPSEPSCRDDKLAGCVGGRSARSSCRCACKMKSRAIRLSPARVHGRHLRQIAIPEPSPLCRSRAIGQFPESPPGNFPIPGFSQGSGRSRSTGVENYTPGRHFRRSLQTALLSATAVRARSPLSRQIGRWWGFCIELIHWHDRAGPAE